MMAGEGVSIMIDSNVFIAAEDHGGGGHAYGADAASLLGLAARLGHQVCVSHGTRSDLMRAPGEVGGRRRRQLTKYHVLERVPDNRVIRAAFPAVLSPNDSADLEVLSTFATGVTTWLVSQDRQLRARARSVGMERVYALTEAVELLQGFSAMAPARLPAADRVPAYTIDLAAPLFDTLKADYFGEFEAWWRTKVVAEDRPAIVLGPASAPQGIAVLKTESPAPYGWPGATLKLCTFKIGEGYQGDKRGELLLKAILDLARAENHSSLYVEVLPDKEDLVTWLEQFGFSIAHGLPASRDQLMLRKTLEPAAGDKPIDPLEHAVRYGPGSLLLEAAHAVPIRDGWHHRLLPEADPQDDLFAGQEACGNAIRKAYLCRASTRLIRPGDGLLFVQTGAGPSRITAVGVTEATVVSADPKAIMGFVGTRTVYSQHEISDMCSAGPVLAILFRLDRTLEPPLPLQDAIAAGALNGPPQSVSRIHEEGLPWIRQQLAV